MIAEPEGIHAAERNMALPPYSHARIAPASYGVV